MKKNNRKKLLDVLSKLMFLMVLSGIFGFVYETIFYRIDLGYFVKRGTTFGPWIPIYAIGGLAIFLACNKIKNKTFLVFLISTLLCGVIEFLAGYLLYNFGHIRLWDYNVEIWNFGNIGGYICLRSVLFFGASGVFLMRILLPIIDTIKSKLGNKTFYVISILFGSIFILDIIVSELILLM